MKMCPVCDGSEIWKAKMTATGDYIYICPECYSFWNINDEIRPDNWEFFEDILENLGREILPTELSEIDKDWDDPQ